MSSALHAPSSLTPPIENAQPGPFRRRETTPHDACRFCTAAGAQVSSAGDRAISCRPNVLIKGPNGINPTVRCPEMSLRSRGADSKSEFPGLKDLPCLQRGLPEDKRATIVGNGSNNGMARSQRPVQEIKSVGKLRWALQTAGAVHANGTGEEWTIPWGNFGCLFFIVFLSCKFLQAGSRVYGSSCERQCQKSPRFFQPLFV